MNDTKWQYPIRFIKCIIDSNRSNEFKKKYNIRVEEKFLTKKLVWTCVTPTIIAFRNGYEIRRWEDEKNTKESFKYRKNKLKTWLTQVIGKMN